jgi:hypothetical protein
MTPRTKTTIMTQITQMYNVRTIHHHSRRKKNNSLIVSKFKPETEKTLLVYFCSNPYKCPSVQHKTTFAYFSNKGIGNYVNLYIQPPSKRHYLSIVCVRINTTRISSRCQFNLKCNPSLPVALKECCILRGHHNVDSSSGWCKHS